MGDAEKGREYAERALSERRREPTAV